MLNWANTDNSATVDAMNLPLPFTSINIIYKRKLTEQARNYKNIPERLSRPQLAKLLASKEAALHPVQVTRLLLHHFVWDKKSMKSYSIVLI